MISSPYQIARYEYAAFLRSKGVTFKEIGNRLGISKNWARMLIIMGNRGRLKLTTED